MPQCGRRNHFARVCRLGTQKTRPKIQELDHGGSIEEDMLVAVIEGTTRKDWGATVTINSQHVTFKIDTGAQCNVMSSDTYNHISRQPLMKSNAKLVAFGGHRLTSLGRATLQSWTVEFEVLSNVLGLKTSTEMKLVKCIKALANDTLSKYADTFTGLGRITGVTTSSSTQPQAGCTPPLKGPSNH